MTTEKSPNSNTKRSSNDISVEEFADGIKKLEEEIAALPDSGFDYGKAAVDAINEATKEVDKEKE